MCRVSAKGPDAHLAALNDGTPRVDATSFAPYLVHRVVRLDFDKQIPKKGDQRQMEPWQRIGTYAAGLALDSAGVKGNAELLGRMDMIVAAGGGERDGQVDLDVLAGVAKANKPEAYVNERLMNDLRPTLFLAQLANLLAGNISIVHGVTGSSRTFMGEESAGVDAVRIAQARIAAGQSDLALVGGAYNAERWEVVLHFALGRSLIRGEHGSVWERAGMALGTIGAFLVLEEKGHAQARGAKPARPHRRGRVGSRAAHPRRGDRRARTDVVDRQVAARPGACGGDLGGERRAACDLRGTRVSCGRRVLRCAPRGRISAMGWSRSFRLTSRSPRRRSGAAGCLPRPTRSSARWMAAAPVLLRQVVVTSIGHWRGEGLVLLEAAS